MAQAKQRIALLHATPVAMEPIADAMRRLWPDAEAVNILDDGLAVDRAKESDELSEELIERFVGFGRYAVSIGADGILVTCSAFGPAIERMAEQFPIPVVKPNEAMFREAMARGKRIGMLATFAPAVPTMEDEFATFAAQSGFSCELKTVVVPNAIDLLRQGKVEEHNRLVGEAAPQIADIDALMLAHFSTSRAADTVRRKIHTPVFCAPDAAVARMQSLVVG